MIANLGIPTSAIRAATDRHAATAQNVANVSNDKAPRARVDQATALPAGGVTAQSRVMESTTGGLVDDMADMSLTGLQYTANLTVLRTQDQMAGTLVDLLA